MFLVCTSVCAFIHLFSFLTTNISWSYNIIIHLYRVCVRWCACLSIPYYFKFLSNIIPAFTFAAQCSFAVHTHESHFILIFCLNITLGKYCHYCCLLFLFTASPMHFSFYFIKQCIRLHLMIASFVIVETHIYYLYGW